MSEHGPRRATPPRKPDRIDPITTSVIQGALENIAVEMGYKLMRMSYSSIIRESEDFGAALVDAEGRRLCRIGADRRRCSRARSPAMSAASSQTWPSAASQIRPGDVIMHNDPYAGASHGPDVAFIVPVFVAGQADRLRRHHRASSRHRRAVRRARAASSTRSMPTPRACSSRRSRSTTAA